VQAGYNWQFNSLVTGIETDFDLSSAKGSTATSFSGAFGPVLVTDASNISRRLNNFGTIRTRIGFAIDRTLFYATGGLAYGQSRLGYFATASSALGLPLTFDGAGFNSTTAWQTG
jgi:outer membrane immunogenic protein